MRSLVLGTAALVLWAAVSHHFIERDNWRPRERAMEARDAARNEQGTANIKRTLKPLFDDLRKPRTPAEVAAEITPQYFDRFLRSQGKVIWQSQSFPLTVDFVDPETRCRCTIIIDADGQLFAYGTRPNLEQDQARKLRAERVRLLEFYTSAAMWTTVAGLLVGVIAFRGAYRMLYHCIFMVAVVTVALRIATITCRQGTLYREIDGYPWLPVAAGALWYAWAKYHARSPATGRCAACDYDLTGNVSGVCPECGKAIPANQIKAFREECVVNERNAT